jgi:hypothetical protein
VDNTNIENSDIVELAETNSLRDRVSETKITKPLKFVVNFIIAIIQVVLNVYLLVFTLVSAIISGFSYLFDEIHINGISFFIDYIVWFVLVSLLLTNITNVAMKNIRSKEINILWAVNFVGKIKNNFYSKEVDRNHVKTTEDYINEVAQELVEDAITEYKQANAELEEVLIRIQEKTANFPVEFFDSIVRMNELLTYSLIYKDDPRYCFENLLDKFLAELTTFIPGAHQGSIFLYNGEQYKAFGNFNIKESSLRNRMYDFNQGFSGAVATDRIAIWIDNVDTDEAEQEFGFNPNSNRSYAAIYGYPILSPKKETIGIINIHFLKPIFFTDIERVNIEKLTEIVSQYILSLIQLNKYPIDIESDIIIKKGNEGDVDVEADSNRESEEISYTS